MSVLAVVLAIFSALMGGRAVSETRRGEAAGAEV
jgi:hypothetical protein